MEVTEEMKRDTRKLRGRIIEIFGTQQEFAKKIGKTEQTITAKINGRSQFSQEDIIEWCNALDIEAADIGLYFFAPELSNG